MSNAKFTREFSKRYAEDSRWINDNINELTQKYPDHWIAVLEKEVVIASKDLDEVKNVAQKRAAEVGEGQCVYSFVEGLWRFRGHIKVSDSN